MELQNSFKENLFNLESNEFDQRALSIFKYQANSNEIYKSYLGFLSVNPLQVTSVEQIPFLPIEFFKQHKVVSGDWDSDKEFLSSGTASSQRSSHFVKEVQFYHNVAEDIFQSFYSPICDTAFFALLPSYIEQGNSSLVSMVDYFISKSRYKESGFYLNDNASMLSNIQSVLSDGGKAVLFGVTYALLDLANESEVDLSGLVIVETGGMKGRKKEMTKEELYACLTEAFNVDVIHSEYGMTELLSQAYSFEGGRFRTPTWMKVLIRDLNDPFTYIPYGKSGGVNVIDLANIDSCSFIETKDIGVLFEDETFKILGRFDNSDIRGCNLLVS